MKYINNKEYILLDKEKQNIYLNNYIEDLLKASLRKQHASDNYNLPGWPYLQAEQVGVQKVLNKIQTLIKK